MEFIFGVLSDQFTQTSAFCFVFTWGYSIIFNECLIEIRRTSKPYLVGDLGNGVIGVLNEFGSILKSKLSYVSVDRFACGGFYFPKGLRWA